MASILSSIFGRPYTIGELMSIDATRQQKAASCNVILDGTFHELKQEGLIDKFKSKFLNIPTINTYYLILQFKVISDTGNSHKVFIRLDPDFTLKNWSSNRVKIYCDCKDFKFRSAYTLEKRGSLFRTSKINMQLGSSLTDAPKKHKTSLLCKHAFAALSWLMNNYSSIMQTV